MIHKKYNYLLTLNVINSILFPQRVFIISIENDERINIYIFVSVIINWLDWKTFSIVKFFLVQLEKFEIMCDKWEKYKFILKLNIFILPLSGFTFLLYKKDKFLTVKNLLLKFSEFYFI